MTELQAAVGIAQLEKINYILKKNRENKKYLKNNIRKNDIEFRKIIDPKGDLADTLIFMCKNERVAKALNNVLKKKKDTNKKYS